jgi:hypothetical protein
MGRAMALEPFATVAIKMELPDKVQSINVGRDYNSGEWVVSAHIIGIVGPVVVRVEAYPLINSNVPVEEIANKLRVFC